METAIKIAPPRKACPPALQMQIDHANGIISRDAQALRDAMAGAVASLRSAADERTLDRFDEAVDILSGLKTPPKQEPIRHIGPRISPNDPCPCGSGKKYKKCCGGHSN